jgi:ElaB protein
MQTSSKAINKSQNDLARDFQNVVTDAEELIRTVGAEGSSRYNDVSNRVKASIDTAKVRLGEIKETARVRAIDTAKATDDYVRGNPWQAVGIGAAAGVVLGFLLATRRQG